MKRPVTQHLYLLSCLGDFLVLFFFFPLMLSKRPFVAVLPVELRYQTKVANMFDQI